MAKLRNARVLVTINPTTHCLTVREVGTAGYLLLTPAQALCLLADLRKLPWPAMLAHAGIDVRKLYQCETCGHLEVCEHETSLCAFCGGSLHRADV